MSLRWANSDLRTPNWDSSLCRERSCEVSHLGVNIPGVKSFRAEVTRDGERWILRVPSLDDQTEQGERLIDVERRLREAISAKLRIEESYISLELQDARSLPREWVRRPAPPDTAVRPSLLTVRSSAGVPTFFLPKTTSASPLGRSEDCSPMVDD
jgi:hypothetical protein